MKRRSSLRTGLLVAVALVLLASMPLAVSADHVDDRDDDQDDSECPYPPSLLVGCVDVDVFVDLNPTAGYTVPDDYEDVIVQGAVRAEDFDNQDDSGEIDNDDLCHNTVFLDEGGGLDSDADEGWSC
jgi:hypothetical protein